MSHSECQSHPLSETLLGPGLLVLLVADTMRRTGLRGGGQGKKRDPFAGDLGLYFGLERRPVLSPVIGVFRAVVWQEGSKPLIAHEGQVRVRPGTDGVLGQILRILSWRENPFLAKLLIHKAT